MSDQPTVKLVWNGSEATNLDVARETGNGILEQGREIEVSSELAQLLLASNVQWSGEVAPKPLEKMGRAELNAAAAAAGVDAPEKHPNKQAVIDAIAAQAASEPTDDGATGAEEN